VHYRYVHKWCDKYGFASQKLKNITIFVVVCDKLDKYREIKNYN